MAGDTPVTTFSQVVDIAADQGSTVTAKGMGKVFELFTHLAAGGRLDNHPTIPYMTATIFLATIWNDLERKVADD